MKVQQEVKEERDKQRFLTVHDGPPMLDKTVNNSEGLSGSRPTLVECEPIQPLGGRLDDIPSPQLLRKFFCTPFSQVSYQ